MIIGRKAECKDLEEVLQRQEAQLVAVYGRRRVGKTYLIREFFGNRFAFYHTGMHNCSMKEQLLAFRDSLIQYGCDVKGMLGSWREAFLCLRQLIEASSSTEKKVIFLDELPWMDTPRSNFLPSLEYFWNSWASSRKDMIMIVCGSASSWIINKVLKNHGGLYNRVTERLSLRPFTLGECESDAKSTGLALTRSEICSYYMAFGGIPFYWSLLRKDFSVPQNIDHLFFQENGKLRNEYGELFSSLFAEADGYRQIVAALSSAGRGLPREELMEKAAMKNGGKLNERLETLEECGFIRRYTSIGKSCKNALFQLIDNLVLFHFKFLNDRTLNDEHYWSNNYLSTKHNSWAGLAFEHICLQHVQQIKQALQIGGVVSNTYSWYHKPDDVHPHGAQIDLLIDRADQVINLCEIKYSRGKFMPDKAFIEELNRKRQIFIDVTKTKKAVHLTLITTEGLADNAYAREIQSHLCLDDIFSV